MKYFWIVLLAGCSSSAHFVDRGLFNNEPFVTASAADPEHAQALALAAVPAGFERDKAFETPVLSCGLPGEAPVWDEVRKAATRCPSGTYRVDLALLPVSGEEREAVLKSRAVE
jgi:hypothetical protein